MLTLFFKKVAAQTFLRRLNDITLCSIIAMIIHHKDQNGMFQGWQIFPENGFYVGKRVLLTTT